MPDAVTYAGLLSAYGRAGDMDGAYEVWQDMKGEGITPTSYTRVALAEAFGSNATLAAEVMDEATALTSSRMVGDIHVCFAVSKYNDKGASCHPQ